MNTFWTILGVIVAVVALIVFALLRRAFAKKA